MDYEPNLENEINEFIGGLDREIDCKDDLFLKMDAEFKDFIRVVGV